jgi:hypothetical protein
MCIGAVLLFVAFIIAIFAAPHPAQSVFESYLKALGDSAEFKVACACRPSLNNAYEACKKKDVWSFYYAKDDWATGDLLRNLGFNDDCIVKIGARSNVAAPAP